MNVFEFDADRLVRVRLTFPASWFVTLRDIFIERYGQPTATETQPVRTNAGVEYQNDVLIWSGTAIGARLQKYSGVHSPPSTHKQRTSLNAARVQLLRANTSRPRGSASCLDWRGRRARTRDLRRDRPAF